MGKWPEAFPDDCPSEADAVTTTLYHGCDDATSTAEDFAPFATSADPGKRKRAERAGCLGYGLSVWPSKEAALNAQQLFPDWHGKRHIFSGMVTPEHGRLQATPVKKDATHHTFWSFEGVDLRSIFTLAWPPSKGQT